MRATRLITPAALVAAIGTALPAQTIVAERGGSRIEPYVSQMWTGDFDEGNDGPSIGGIGVRLTGGGRPDLGAGLTYLNRAAFGLFVTYMADQQGYDNVSGDAGNVPRSFHGGLQLDVHVFSKPVFGIDPFVSLGAGALRTDGREIRGTLGGTYTEDARTNFVATPGAGTVLWLSPSFGLRGDVRSAYVFSQRRTEPSSLVGGGQVTTETRTTQNWVAELGVNVEF